jgi:hypothetical protein
MGQKRNLYTLLVGRSDGKTPLVEKRRRWLYNIKMALVEIRWGGVDWIGLDQDRNKWS